MKYFERSDAISTEKKNILDKIKNDISRFYAQKGGNGISPDLPIRLHSSTIDADTVSSLVECVLNDNITMGPLNDIYQNNFSNYLRTNNSLSCNSGSSANLIIIFSLLQSGHLKPGDRVIVPALTWSTTIYPLLQASLVPVFCDQSLVDFNIDLDQVSIQAEREDVKAIFLIHTYGCPVNMTRCLDIANKNNLLVIEDTCESMGAKWQSQKLGTFGIASSFSTYFSHHICTFEGGMISTDDNDIYNIMQSVRSHGWARHLSNDDPVFKNNPTIDPAFLFKYIGFNLRLSEPQAAMGIVQLTKLDQYVESRRKNGLLYTELFAKSKFSLTTQDFSHHAYHSYFGIPLFLPSKFDFKATYDLRLHLKNNNIESRPFLAGDFTKQPSILGSNFEVPYDYPIAQQLNDRSIALPCHQDLNEEQIRYTVSKIEDYLSSN